MIEGFDGTSGQGPWIFGALAADQAGIFDSVYRRQLLAIEIDDFFQPFAIEDSDDLVLFAVERDLGRSRVFWGNADERGYAVGKNYGVVVVCDEETTGRDLGIYSGNLTLFGL